MVIRVLFFLLLLDLAWSSDADDFVFNGFRGANLTLDGTAAITPDGLLRLTNATKLLKGHAFYPLPLRFKRSPAGDALSFSSTFVFGIVSDYSQISGNGIVLVISPTADLTNNTGSQYLGILSPSNNGNATNHLIGVELDTIYNPDFEDINDNHIGIDINSMTSFNASAAGYYADATGGFKNLTLISGDPMQVWVEFDSREKRLDVTLSPLGMVRPSIPLLSSTINLSAIIEDQMYVGFSSSTGSFLTSHYILGWSFKVNGEARSLNISALPSLPPRLGKKHSRLALAVSVSLGSLFLVLVIISAGVFTVIRKIKFSELIEDWEADYGSHRFSYRDLYAATEGFKEKGLLGAGGFGKVYKGVLPSSKTEVAVKRVSHESRQGMKEFIAEIVSIGRLRHRNLVQLLGYCRRKGELLLVYDYMPHGSLDRLLFDPTSPALDWSRRFHIIKGVASGLLYLHEEWEKVVIHRDVKASNVLLDGELNGRLGDFGLARLYDHGNDPRTTHVVGTMGYLAPELTRTGKATKATDVFAFGAFLLEVACGRRPIEQQAPGDEVVLVAWVLRSWRRGAMTECADLRLEAGETAAAAEEVEMVLTLGLLCSHPVPAVRPSMRQVLQYLDGGVPVPELSSIYLDASVLEMLQHEAFDRDNSASTPSSFSTDSFLNTGR